MQERRLSLSAVCIQAYKQQRGETCFKLIYEVQTSDMNKNFGILFVPLSRLKDIEGGRWTNIYSRYNIINLEC